MSHNYEADDVQHILSVFADRFAVDIPAAHIDGDYLIPLASLEYFLAAPEPEWIAEVTAAVNE